MQRPEQELTAEHLRSVLKYDPETGVFTRVRSTMTSLVGKPAGWPQGNGYWCVGVGSFQYLRSRLAWLYVNGKWPSEIDHINGDPSDDRIANLRECSRRENICNRRKPKHNQSGFKGVCRVGDSKNWRAHIRVDGRQIHLGTFPDPESAHAAYRAAAEEFHGKFARTT